MLLEICFCVISMYTLLAFCLGYDFLSHVIIMNKLGISKGIYLLLISFNDILDELIHYLLILPFRKCSLIIVTTMLT